MLIYYAFRSDNRSLSHRGSGRCTCDEDVSSTLQSVAMVPSGLATLVPVDAGNSPAAVLSFPRR